MQPGINAYLHCFHLNLHGLYIYRVFFSQVLSTVFTASLRYTKLFIPSSTVWMYSWFIDLGICTKHVLYKEEEKQEKVRKRNQDYWSILNLGEIQLHINEIKLMCNWTQRREARKQQSALRKKEIKLLWKSPDIGNVTERRYQRVYECVWFYGRKRDVIHSLPMSTEINFLIPRCSCKQNTTISLCQTQYSLSLLQYFTETWHL